jgi:hypothetical protein
LLHANGAAVSSQPPLPDEHVLPLYHVVHVGRGQWHLEKDRRLRGWCDGRYQENAIRPERLEHARRDGFLEVVPENEASAHLIHVVD